MARSYIIFWFLLFLQLTAGCSTKEGTKTPNPSAQPVILSNQALSLEAKLQQGVDITGIDLEGLSATELHFLQYVPDARYGRTFDDDAEVKAFFSSRPWYRSNPNYDGSMLSQTDVHNYVWVKLAADKSKDLADADHAPLFRGAGKPHSTSPSPSTETSISRPNLPDATLRDEARRQADKLLDTLTKQCGQYYRVGIVEGRSVWYPEIIHRPTVSVEGEEVPATSLTEADRLNGVDPRPIEWKGIMIVTFGPWRSRTTELGKTFWTGWNDSYKAQFYMVRKKGKWLISPGGINMVLLKCESIPKEWQE